MLQKIIVAIVGAFAAAIAGYIFGHGHFTINAPVIINAPRPEVSYPQPAQRDSRCNPCAPGYNHSPRPGAPCGCGR
jgi:hypothetical protein